MLGGGKVCPTRSAQAKVDPERISGMIRAIFCGFYTCSKSSQLTLELSRSSMAPEHHTGTRQIGQSSSPLQLLLPSSSRLRNGAHPAPPVTLLPTKFISCSSIFLLSAALVPLFFLSPSPSHALCARPNGASLRRFSSKVHRSSG